MPENDVGLGRARRIVLAVLRTAYTSSRTLSGSLSRKDRMYLPVRSHGGQFVYHHVVHKAVVEEAFRLPAAKRSGKIYRPHLPG